MATGTRVASLYAAVGADLSGLEKGLKTASQRLKGFAKGAASLGFAAIGTAALVAGKKATSMAADFEAAMNVMEVAASSSGTSLETLRQVTLAVGGDTRLVGINASQAADAMTEFYRAGLTTNQIMGDLNGYLNEGAQLSGVMRAAVDLQAASEMQLAQASEAVTVAMKTFNLAAEDAPGITDNFVKSADASVASVSELVDALKNVGPTAASFGWSLEETNTALAILSQRGIKGAEAGTALKSMMTNLMRDTPKVTGALQQMGITLYDASGQMRALPEILGQLEQGLANATEEERNLAIQTLADTYGMKAMNTLLAEGSRGWDVMAQAVNSAAGAEEVATKRTQGFKGAMESLEGAMETLMIETATPFLQNTLTPLVEKTTEIVDVVNKAAGAFRALKGGMGAAGGGDIGGFFQDPSEITKGIETVDGQVIALQKEFNRLLDASELAKEQMSEHPVAALVAYKNLREQIDEVGSAIEHLKDPALAITTAGGGDFEETLYRAFEATGGETTASIKKFIDDYRMTTATALENVQRPMGDINAEVQAKVEAARAVLNSFGADYQAVMADMENMSATTAQSSSQVVETWAANQEALNARLDAAWQGHVAKWSGMWAELNSIDMEGQQALLTQQQEWAQQDAAMAEQAALERITAEQDRAMKLAEIQNEYAAKIEAARAASNQAQVAQLQAKQEQELGLAQQSFAKQDALTQRALMVEEVQRQQSRIRELQALQQHYQQKLAMQVIQAGAEQDLTNKQIEARLTALGIELQEEHKLAIEHAKLNQEKAKSDQAYAKTYVANLKGIIGAAIEARQNDLQTAMDKLNQWQPPELPDIPIPDVTGPSLGGGGGASSVTGATNTVVESIDQTVTRITTAVDDAVNTLKGLEDFEGVNIEGPLEALGANLEQIINSLMHTAWKFGDANRDWRDIPKAAAEFAGYAGQAASGLGQAAGAISKIAEMETADIDDKLVIIVDQVGSILERTDAMRAAFASTRENWQEAMADIAAFAQYTNQSLGWIGNATSSLTALAEYGDDANRSLELTQRGIDYLYLNTQAVLGMLDHLAPGWGELASEVAEGAANIGDALRPMSDMTGGILALADFFEEGSERFGTVQVAIDHLYVQAQAVLGMLDHLAPGWGELAESVKEGTGHIGDAMAPLDDMTGGIIALVDYFEDGASRFGTVQVAIDHLYIQAQMALGMLDNLAPAWGDIAKGAKEGAGHIGDALKPLDDMVGGLLKVGEYEADVRPTRGMMTNLVQDIDTMLGLMAEELENVPKKTRRKLARVAKAGESMGNLIENGLGSIIGIVDNRDYLGFVSSHSQAFAHAIENQLAPALTTIAEKLNTARPEELVGADKFKAWDTGLDYIKGIVDKTQAVIDGINKLGQANVDAVMGQMSHLGALLGGIQTGAQAAGVPMGPSGGGGINVNVNVNVGAGAGRGDLIREIIAQVEAALIEKLGAAGVYA